ncbi:hypothetical protein B0H14DRAFT_3429516 [Mycena olivaceomarginata]|nr:hypothetical protein B0H14DRAFT_3429516 [Mycena olivaceomarginata]
MPIHGVRFYVDLGLYVPLLLTVANSLTNMSAALARGAVLRVRVGRRRGMWAWGVVQGVRRVGCEVRDAGCGSERVWAVCGWPRCLLAPALPMWHEWGAGRAHGMRGVALLGCGAWRVWTARGRQCTGRSLVHTCVTAPAPAADARRRATHSTPSHPRSPAHHLEHAGTSSSTRRRRRGRRASSASAFSDDMRETWNRRRKDREAKRRAVLETLPQPPPPPPPPPHPSRPLLHSTLPLCCEDWLTPALAAAKSLPGEARYRTPSSIHPSYFLPTSCHLYVHTTRHRRPPHRSHTLLVLAHVSSTPPPGYVFLRLRAGKGSKLPRMRMRVGKCRRVGAVPASVLGPASSGEPLVTTRCAAHRGWASTAPAF